MRSSKIHPTIKNLFFSGLLIIIYLLGWNIQSELLFNWDVSWLIHVSKRLLAGGTYSKDFFELNPPMILYLYIPTVLLAKYTSLSIIIALRCYVFFLASFSLLICYKLARKIFPIQSPRTTAVLIATLAICYLILPFYEFGQRENLMLMLITPYLMLVTHRLQGGKTGLAFALLIGGMAGLGFAIKPYFLITFALIETYFVLKTRSLFAWIRIETVTIISISIIYLIGIYIFHNDYITTVIPIALRTYYDGVATPWFILIQHITIPFCCITIAFYFMTYEKNPIKIFSTILFIALIGFSISFFLQHTYWHYHLLPMYSVTILLAALLFNNALTESSLTKIKLIFLCLLLLATPIFYSYQLISWGLAFKNSTQKIIAFMQKNAVNKSIYLFASSTVYLFPEVDYANAIPASRTESLGWARTIAKQQDPMGKEDSKFYIHMIVEDFNIKKPDYVFVDTQQNKAYLGNIKFDYLNYFSNYPEFKHAWKFYRYLATIDNEPYYKFEIYQRTK